MFLAGVGISVWTKLQLFAPNLLALMGRGFCTKYFQYYNSFLFTISTSFILPSFLTHKTCAVTASQRRKPRCALPLEPGAPFATKQRLMGGGYTPLNALNHKSRLYNSVLFGKMTGAHETPVPEAVPGPSESEADRRRLVPRILPQPP